MLWKFCLRKNCRVSARGIQSEHKHKVWIRMIYLTGINWTGPRNGWTNEVDAGAKEDYCTWNLKRNKSLLSLMRVYVNGWLGSALRCSYVINIAYCAVFTRSIIAYFHLNVRCVRIFDPTVFAIFSSCVTQKTKANLKAWRQNVSVSLNHAELPSKKIGRTMANSNGMQNGWMAPHVHNSNIHELCSFFTLAASVEPNNNADIAKKRVKEMHVKLVGWSRADRKRKVCTQANRMKAVIWRWRISTECEKKRVEKESSERKYETKWLWANDGVTNDGRDGKKLPWRSK